MWVLLIVLQLLAVAGCAGVPGDTAADDRSEFFKRDPERKNTKVVVFVHGFTGHYRETWGKFPDLIVDDPELRDVDIFLWGYPSGYVGKSPSVELVGQALKTALNTKLQTYDRVFLVGHSLGGLVIQSMVLDELKAGHAPNMRRIRHIVLFATPNQGLELPGIVRVLGPKAYDLVVNQEKIDTLRTEWINRVYNPIIASGDANYKLKIPVTPVIGLEDSLVPVSSARSFFQNPEPETVPGDHVTVKLPNNQGSSSYLIVKSRLLELLRWSRVEINVGDEEEKIPRNHTWTDISWIGSERGWLSGIVAEGGGGGDVGKGILLSTIDGGRRWFENAEFESGSGEFTWGPHGTRRYSWNDVGPIKELGFYSRVVREGRHVEGWAATSTGIYVSRNVSRDGRTGWRRLSPPPDHPDRYAFFSGMADIEGFSEIYAVGWQGIAHWSSLADRWVLEKPTYFYDVASVAAAGGSENRSVWAVGRVGEDEFGNRGDRSHGAVYRLLWPANRWQQVPLAGIQLEVAQTLNDVLIQDHETIFVVGEKGLVLRGVPDGVGGWRWTRLQTPTTSNLRSITMQGSRLWVVGSGVILTSADAGNHWTQLPRVLDDKGQALELIRVRFFGLVGWIVGNRIVLKSEPS